MKFLQLLAIEQKHHGGTGCGSSWIHRTAKGSAAGATQVRHGTFPLGEDLREGHYKGVRSRCDGHTDMEEPYPFGRRQIRIVQYGPEIIFAVTREVFLYQ